MELNARKQSNVSGVSVSISVLKGEPQATITGELCGMDVSGDKAMGATIRYAQVARGALASLLAVSSEVLFPRRWAA